MQLRKAQQSEDLGKKQGTALSCKLSSASITSKKKQYTVPHPLSGKLSCVSSIKPTAEFDSMHATLRHIFETASLLSQISCSYLLICFSYVLANLNDSSIQCNRWTVKSQLKTKIKSQFKQNQNQ